MPDRDVEIREALERLTGPAERGGGVSFERLVRRRRRRRVRRAVVAVVPGLVVVGLVGAGLLRAANDRAPDVVAGADEPDAPAPGREVVTVVGTRVVAEDGATTRVVMEFDRPLPDGGVTYVRDQTVVNLPTGGFYTTQNPDAAHVCDGVHSFGSAAIGTVDLLLPSTWFAELEGSHTSDLERLGEPPKFVVCGPYRGFYQYSIWGPASADPFDVTVTVAGDRRQLTIDIAPTSGRAPDSGPAPIEGERSRVCAGLVRAADDSRLELQELDRAVASAAQEVESAEDPEAAEARLEMLRARRGVVAARSADVTVEADALGC